jgi:hypothetical protein
MAINKKISNLNFRGAAAPYDLLAIVNIGLVETQKIRIRDLMGSPGPIGSISPNSGDFTDLSLPTGATINEFSIDGTLAGNSDTAIPTEKAVKTYVDNQMGSALENGNLSLSNGDTTAEVIFSDAQDTTNYSIAYSLVNLIDDPPASYSGTVFEKTVNGFKVIFSGPMDSDNYTLSWIVNN